MPRTIAGGRGGAEAALGSNSWRFLEDTAGVSHLVGLILGLPGSPQWPPEIWKSTSLPPSSVGPTCAWGLSYSSIIQVDHEHVLIKKKTHKTQTHMHRANSNNPTLPLPSQTHSVPGGTTVYSSVCIAAVHFLGVYLYVYIIRICFGRFIYTPHIVFCSLLFPAHHMSWRSSHVGSHKPASFIFTAASEPPYGCTRACTASPPCQASRSLQGTSVHAHIRPTGRLP